MLAIIGGTILPICEPPYTGGVVFVDKGKIIGIGREGDIPAGATIIDGRGKYITPGLIDAHTHLGIYAEQQAWAGEDVNETSQPVTPGMQVIDAINPADAGLADACAGGVTTVMVAPGSANPIGGQAAIIKTRRQATVEDMLVRRHAGLKIAFGENPRRAYGNHKKMPVTRMATAALIRETLLKGREYMAKAADKERNADLGLEAVVRVLRREMPLRAHAHRADDIVTALRIAREFNVDIIIEHATEGHLIPEVLAERQARVVLGPHLITRSKHELNERSFAAPAVLAAHGVPFALMSDHPVVPSAFLTVYAGLAVRFGLGAEHALRAITLDAAEILGIADRVGAIAPGKDADLVVWRGHPLELTAMPEWVIVDGWVGKVNKEQKIVSWEPWAPAI